MAMPDTNSEPIQPTLAMVARRPVWYNAYVLHLSDPSDRRTTKMFADENGVSPATIYSYLGNHREEMYLAAEKIRARFIPVMRTAAWKSVYANLETSFQDRQLALRLVGDLVETTKATLDIKTPDEKRALISQIMAGLSERLSRDNGELPKQDKGNPLPGDPAA